jgi:hypothetical protein
MAFNFIKKGAYQTAVDIHLWNYYGKNIDKDLGGWKKAELATLVFDELKKENNISEAKFIQLYIAELVEIGYL